VAVIFGSTRTGRFGSVPAKWIAPAKAMFDQLAWWGHVLCDARARQPYPG
jgi:hypothetical protein